MLDDQSEDSTPEELEGSSSFKNESGPENIDITTSDKSLAEENKN
jgi:hypothetical protein